MYSPCLGEFLAGERGRVIARAGVGLDARHGDAAPDLPAQPLQLRLQRVQFGPGNADQFGCFGAHAAPSVRGFRPKCRSLRPGRAVLQLTLAVSVAMNLDLAASGDFFMATDRDCQLGNLCGFGFYVA
jgi:hypothetical protein